MNDTGGVRRFQSLAVDAVTAVRELHAGLQQPDLALVVFHCSPLYDLDVIAAQMRAAFAGVQVIGCTTAGEVGTEGYREHSLVGVSFSARHFGAVAGCVRGLRSFSVPDGRRFALSLLRDCERQMPATSLTASFALMYIDGLSGREEQVVHAFQQGLGNTPLLGGSAGDERSTGKSYIYCDGEFLSDAAALAVISTDLPISYFKSQHFKASDTRLVVTGADVDSRIVREINGLPAAQEYARLVGVTPDALDATLFAAWPLVMKINGIDYVRSIQKANPDGSLTFYCAIEDGLVLRLAHGTDMVAALEDSMKALRDRLGEPQVILGCDCVLRALEFEQAGVKAEIDAIYRHNQVLGFRSYGEQYLGIHVNQTLTGLGIGLPRGNSDV